MRIITLAVTVTIAWSAIAVAQDRTDELADMPELQFDKNQQEPLIVYAEKEEEAASAG